MSNTRLTPAEILELIPQKAPFRFVDEILSVNEKEIIGTYTFKKNEFFYPGHFPGLAITPGVILLESMMQIGLVGLMYYLLSFDFGFNESKKWKPVLTEAQIEIERAVYPETKVVVHAHLVFWRSKKIRAQINMYDENQNLLATASAAGLGIQT